MKAEVVTTKTTTSPAQLKEASDNIVRIKDANGRQIGVRKELDVLDEMRLLKVLGGENASYLYFCSQLARVAEIGGEEISQPNSDREFQMLAKRLDRPGVNRLTEYFSGVETSATETDGRTEQEAVKK